LTGHDADTQAPSCEPRALAAAFGRAASVIHGEGWFRESSKVASVKGQTIVASAADKRPLGL
jgi:predicted nucleic acid-binding Zn ribbon protein